MLLYFLLIGLIILDFGVEYLFKNKKVLIDGCNSTKVNKCLSFVFKYRLITIISLVIFSTFKSLNVGMDMPQYVEYYRYLGNNKSELFKDYLGNVVESGYTFLNSLLVLIGVNFRVLLFVTSLFVSVSMVLFINKLSCNKLMSVLLYIMLGTFAQSLCTLRQIIALAFLMLAIIKLIDKKWISSIILILAGMTFHISAILCLVIVPLRFIKPKWWLICVFFVLTIIGSVVFPYILKLLEKFTVFDYYTKYYVELAHLRGASNLLNTLYSISLVGLFTIMYIAGFKILRLEDKDKVIYDFCLLIFMFVPLFRISGFILEMPELFNRLNIYFFISLFVLIPLFVKGVSYNNNLYRITYISVYVISICYMVYLYAIKNSCGVTPFIFM